MLARNYRLANWLGFLSIVLTAIPAASLLLSVGAGLLGSRLWFLALLGPAIVMALVLFSP